MADTTIGNTNLEGVASLRWIDAIIACVIIYVALDNLPLHSSLWLDETLTYWIASGSLEDAWRRAIQFQGQSPLYYLIVWGILQVFPDSDLMLRVFSVVCGCVALVGFRLFIPVSSRLPLPMTLIASCALATDSFQRALISARPYAFAIACATFSMYLFAQWMKSQRATFLVGWILCTALTVYAHYLFGVIVIAQLCYFFLQRPFDFRQLVRITAACAALGILLIPGFSQLYSLSLRSSVLQLVGAPSFTEVCAAMLPPPLLVLVAVGVTLGVIWGGKFAPEEHSRALFPLALVWSFVPVVIFALGSLLTPTSLFVSRYWSWQVGGLALLVTLAVSSLSTARARRIAFYVVVLGMLFRVAGQQWTVEGWREAAQELSKNPTTPVVLFSGLIEAEDSEFYRQSEALPYLRAPLARYGGRNSSERVIQPVGLSANAFQVQSLPLEEFLLLAARGRRGGGVSPGAFVERLTSGGRRVELLGEFGTLSLYRVGAS